MARGATEQATPTGGPPMIPAVALAMKALEPFAPFVATHSFMRAAWTAALRNTIALIEQAQPHAECHPAALCDGPEQARAIERATWGEAGKIVQAQRKGNMAASVDGYLDFLASTFAARAAAQGGK